MIDTALLLTLLVIIASALLGVVLSRRRTDPCLKLWRGFPVRLARVDRPEQRGRLAIYGNGFVVHPEDDAGAGQEGLVVYQDEYDWIGLLIRAASDLTPEARRERLRSVRRLRRPGPRRRLLRSMRMWLNAIRDGVGESVGTIARLSGVAPVAASQSLSESSKSALSAAYDPLLEAHLGRTVIVETSSGGSYRALLQEYSVSFLCLMDAAGSGGAGDWGDAEVDLIVARAGARVRRIASQTGSG